MLTLTDAAILHLRALMLEHPDDPIVRITLKDLNDQKLVINITLEDRVQPDDIVRVCEGLTVAVSGDSAPRMEGVTLDYQESRGFLFRHPPEEESDLLGNLSLN